MTGLSGFVMTKYITLYNVGVSTKLVSHPTGDYVNLRSSREMGQNNVILRVPHGEWVMVTVTARAAKHPAYGGQKGLLLTAVSVEPAAEPEQEVAAFY